MSGRKKHNSNEIVAYRRTVVKVRRPKPGPLSVDPALVDQILLKSIEPKGLKVTGKCYDCGRAISGERRYCGSCFAKH